MKKSKVCLLLAMLMCFVLSAAAHAQEVVSDYFYPDGRSVYYVYKDKDSNPVEKVDVRFERTSKGGRMDEDPPIPLIGGIMYNQMMETLCYNLDITDTTVTARTWWTKSAGGGLNSRGNTRYNLVMLKLPAKDETLTWTTEVNKDGKILQIWEMSAKRTFLSVKKDNTWIAVPAVEVKRNVFDPQHNPLPGQSVTEYWQQGRGKVKVIRSK